MKIVKSLLLGSAAGLVAVVGAQAADLPVKAKPVEYVKVCSLYGAGFWYVPGTDTCLKIGSYIRVQSEYGAGNGGIPIGMADGATGGRFTRSDTSDYSFRVRASLSVDLRTQTEYGTLRSYLEVGQQWTTATNAAAGSNAPGGDLPFIDRGFIQFAGLTAGRIRSFFDINSFAPYGYSNVRFSADTGANGIYGVGYTVQFGNGFSGTLSIEDSGLTTGGRGRTTADVSAQVWAPVTAVTTDNKGVQFPDIVGNLRVDQAWGYAAVSAAAHDNSGAYYLTPDLTTSGHPSDKWGWAATAGFTLKNVLGLAGDEFGVQVAYGQGAGGYVAKMGTYTRYAGGAEVGLGYYADSIFATGTGIELTNSWSANAFYQHLWNPNWRTSVYGGYVGVDYNSAATAIICGTPNAAGLFTPAGATGAGGGFVAGTVSNCSPDFSFWQVGTRTQWNPHPDLDIGLDLLWTHLNSAYKGTATLTSSGARPAGVYAIADEDVLTAMFRIQRNFLP